MTDGTYMSWEEVQHLMLPPNATLLVPPPPPDPVDVAALAAGPPPRPDWLDDAFVAPPRVAEPAQAPVDQAAQQTEHDSGPVRLLANLITYGALVEYVQSRQEKGEKEKPRLPEEPEPE